MTGTATQPVSTVTQQVSGTVQQTTSNTTQTVQNTTSGATQTVNSTTSNTTQKVQNTTSGATQPVKQTTSDATQAVTSGGGGGGGPVQDVASQTGTAVNSVTSTGSGVRKSGTGAVARGGKARATSRSAGVVIPNARPIPATCGQALRGGPIAFAHWMATFKGLGGSIGYRSASSGTSGGRPFTGGPESQKAPQAMPKVPLPEAPGSGGRVLTIWLIIGALMLAATATYLSGRQMVTGSWNPFRRQ